MCWLGKFVKVRHIMYKKKKEREREYLHANKIEDDDDDDSDPIAIYVGSISVKLIWRIFDFIYNHNFISQNSVHLKVAY